MAGLTSRSAVRIAGNVATGLFVVAIALQLLLAAGVLPITMAWGGTQTVLTPGLRLASVAAAVILVLFAYVIRRRAGLAGSDPPSRTIRILAWLITGFLVLNTLGNVVSPSPGERVVFAPLSFLTAVACFVVAIPREA